MVSVIIVGEINTSSMVRNTRTDHWETSFTKIKIKKILVPVSAQWSVQTSEDSEILGG